MYMDKKQKSSPTKDNVGAFFQTCKVWRSIKISLWEVRKWDHGKLFVISINCSMQPFTSSYALFFFLNYADWLTHNFICRLIKHITYICASLTTNFHIKTIIIMYLMPAPLCWICICYAINKQLMIISY